MHSVFPYYTYFYQDITDSHIADIMTKFYNIIV